VTGVANIGQGVLVRDLEHFEPVPDPEHMQAGDLVWLGVDRPRVEQERFVPRYDGDELVNGGDFPALWPLRRFRDYDRYGSIYAIRRLRREFPG
jgi:hypothetical protein